MDPVALLPVIEELADSSSDEDEDKVVEIATAVLIELQASEDVVKCEGFVFTILERYDDETFRQHLRLRKSSFDKLVDLFRSSTFMPKYCAGRENVSAERHILIFLWFAGTKQVVRTVAHLFDVSFSSFHRILTRVMMFLYHISPNFIQLPNTLEAKARIANQFQRIAGFPNVIGCIDGSYIPIQTPARKIKSTYVNRHHQTALTLQGVCDAHCRFLDVITGFSSKMHDARIFKLSFIYPKLRTLCGPNNTYHLLGDAAYPIGPCLLTPYRNTDNLTTAQSSYNKAFSKTRVKIENAFGLLKGRFRQLIRLDFHSVERACYFIIACCVLHNICIDWDDEDFGSVEETDEPRPQEDSSFTNEDKELGELKRNFIAMNSDFH